MSIRLEGHMQTTQQNAPLKRTMKTRHLIMLSLGGVIGTGLFFNTGYIISTTGAAGTLLAYLIGALVVWLVMQCLGELSVAMPETGAFHVYAARYLGPATGYTVAWLYWLTRPWRLAPALPPLVSACSTGSHRCRCGSGAWFSALLSLA